MEPVNIFEYEALARERLSAMAYDFIAGGADDEVTVRDNRAAFDRLRLRPRVLVAVGTRDLTTTVLGQQISFPVLVAPTGLQCLAHPDGELATARAAGAAGTIMVLSTSSNYSIEEVAAVASGPLWFQLYCYRDRGITKMLVERAQAAGFRALCVTVDAPVLGNRERDKRSGFTLPPGLERGNLHGIDLAKLAGAEAPLGRIGYDTGAMDADLTWKDIEWLAGLTSLPIVIKGILTAEDAQLAVEYGAAGLIVSNHGGRQLDSAIAAADALPEVVEAVEGRVEVLMDGGIRRGTDVLKALALGAKAVLVGRPVVWGLACDGEAGVRRVLEILRSELDLAMALVGRPTIASIDRSLLAPVR